MPDAAGGSVAAGSSVAATARRQLAAAGQERRTFEPAPDNFAGPEHAGPWPGCERHSVRRSRRCDRLAGMVGWA
jgi:hypothetical protein